MVMSIEAPPITPDGTLLSSYQVVRLGLCPAVELTYVNVRKLWEPSVTVNSIDASNLPVVTSWLGRTDLIGREVFTTAEVSLGTITMIDAVTAAVSGLTGATEGMLIKLQALSVTGSPGWQEYGSYRQIVLESGSQAAAQYLGEKMGGAFFAAVSAVLAELGDVTYTPQQILGAIVALAARGENIDTYIAQTGELVEQDRRDNLLPAGTRLMGF
jgi:hypothetical protein